MKSKSQKINNLYVINLWIIIALSCYFLIGNVFLQNEILTISTHCGFSFFLNKVSLICSLLLKLNKPLTIVFS